jgi:hypothetical protein
MNTQSISINRSFVESVSYPSTPAGVEKARRAAKILRQRFARKFLVDGSTVWFNNDTTRPVGACLVWGVLFTTQLLPEHLTEYSQLVQCRKMEAQNG